MKSRSRAAWIACIALWSTQAIAGVGRSYMKTWVVPVSSIKIGDEEILNTQLRIGKISLPRADMLLGTDFFLSHHLYLSNSQHKIYFTR